MLKIWKLQISLLGIFCAAILVEISIIPSLWAPLRVDFLIGLIIGQVIFIPFYQGFSFVVLASLMMEAFSGARIGLIPLLYVALYLATDLLKEVIYLENVYVQAVLGVLFYFVLAGSTAMITGTSFLGDMIVPLVAGMVLTGLVSPFMARLVGRLQTSYGLREL
ncbi:MAG TPA: hypothetical protein PKM41_09515 [Deltaproteobacteria bacterium]|nr:hypothetical protein [Deltaproteobacteria bacterium]HOI07717.1 hypothetical protein [Deltaproteobacteria bacterium]